MTAAVVDDLAEGTLRRSEILSREGCPRLFAQKAWIPRDDILVARQFILCILQRAREAKGGNLALQRGGEFGLYTQDRVELGSGSGIIAPVEQQPTRFRPQPEAVGKAFECLFQKNFGFIQPPELTQDKELPKIDGVVRLVDLQRSLECIGGLWIVALFDPQPTALG